MIPIRATFAICNAEAIIIQPQESAKEPGPWFRGRAPLYFLPFTTASRYAVVAGNCGGGDELGGSTGAKG
jgi:hypothetical protein